eukprot:3431188-Amphidinium_carterae.3
MADACNDNLDFVQEDALALPTTMGGHLGSKLEPARKRPALKQRLQGPAKVYRNLLDKDRLHDPATGAKYFIDVL